MAVARGTTFIPRSGFSSLAQRPSSHSQALHTSRRQQPPFPNLTTSRKLHLVRYFTHQPHDQDNVRLLEEDDPTDDAAKQPAEVHLPEPQVLSDEEQARLSATPAHPESLYALYAIHFASCIVEHAWHFGLPAVIAILHHTFLPVAAEGFVSQLVIFVGGPWIGALMDSMPRAVSFNLLSIVQTICMVVSATIVVYVLNTGTSSLSGLLFRPWFILLMISGALERLTGLACGVAFERDWVVLLAGPNRSIALANANAILRRVDLVCEIAGPFLFGILLSRYSPVVSTCIAAVAMAASLPLLIFLVHCTYKLSKGVLDRPKLRNPARDEQSATSATTSSLKVLVSSSPGASAEEGFRAIQRGWVAYLAQPILPASLAYVLLYFNAVLGPGGLITSYLTQQGLSPSIIGAFRGLCALMGFVATFVSSILIKKVGVLKAGLTALVFQAALLVMAVGVYFFTRMTHSASLFTFLLLIVVSRLGFWVYDMVDAQIFQTEVPPAQANLVGTTEVSLASLAELVMMGVAIVASDVSHFGSLSALSMLAVVGAACIYWRWLAGGYNKVTTSW